MRSKKPSRNVRKITEITAIRKYHVTISNYFCHNFEPLRLDVVLLSEIKTLLVVRNGVFWHWSRFFRLVLVDFKYLLVQQNSDACFCKITCLVQSVLCKELNRKHFNQSRHFHHHVTLVNIRIFSRDQ